MSTTVAKVFGTTELLEEILLNTDELSLLRMKGVNKQWKESIETSPKIRKALFILGETKDHAYEYEEGALVPHTYLNPLVLRVSQPVRPEPLGIGVSRFDLRGYLGNKEVPKNASCRNMLIIQPPVNTIEFSVRYFYTKKSVKQENKGKESMFNPGWYFIKKTVENVQGVRVGDVLQILEDMGVEGTVDIELSAIFFPEKKLMPMRLLEWKHTLVASWEAGSNACGQSVKVAADDARLMTPEVKVRAKQLYHYELKGGVCRPIEKFNLESEGRVVKRYDKGE